MSSENTTIEHLGQVKDNIAESLDRIEAHIKIRVDSITDEGTAALRANRRGVWITAALVIVVGIVLAFTVPRITSDYIIRSISILEIKKAEHEAEIQRLHAKIEILKNTKTDMENEVINECKKVFQENKTVFKQQIQDDFIFRDGEQPILLDNYKQEFGGLVLLLPSNLKFKDDLKIHKFQNIGGAKVWSGIVVLDNKADKNSDHR